MRAAQESVQKYMEQTLTFTVMLGGAHFLLYFNETLLGLKGPREP